MQGKYSPLILLICIVLLEPACRKTKTNDTTGSSTFFKVYTNSCYTPASIFCDKQANIYLLGTDTNLYLIKMDTKGVMLWKKEFPSGLLNTGFTSMITTDTRIYMMRSDAASNYYLYGIDYTGMVTDSAQLVLDQAGQFSFFTYGNPFSNPVFMARSAGGNFAFLARTSDSTNNPYNYHNVPVLSIFSGSGQLIRNVCLDTIYIDTPNLCYTFPKSVLGTNDGGYLILVEAYKYGYSQFSLQIYRLNANGDRLSISSYRDVALNLTTTEYGLPQILVSENSDGTFDVLTDDYVSISSGQFKKYGLYELDADHNYFSMKYSYIDYASDGAYRKPDGNYIMYNTLSDTIFSTFMTPKSCVVKELSPDLSLIKTQTFGSKDAVFELSGINSTADGQCILFGSTQTIGKRGDSTYSNFLIKLNENENF